MADGEGHSPSRNERYLNGQNLIDEAAFRFFFGPVMIEHQSSPLDLPITIPHWFSESLLLGIEANKSCPHAMAPSHTADGIG